tara:strand:+ start:6199 stop:6591 length:393 start_codon:yes stop_codon:yes gene_type:complete
VSSEKFKGVYRLGHNAIRVEDINRAKTFYKNLGMRIVWDAQDWCYLEAYPSHDGLALLGPEYKSAGPHFAFHFKKRDEIDNAHEFLKSSGIEVGKIHEHRDGTASFYLKDTEGNWLEMLYEPPNGISSKR